MISKQLFVEAINMIMSIKDYQADKMKLWKKYGADGYLIEPSCEAIMLKIIKESFGRCEELEAIETFCYQNNFGRGKNHDIYMDSYGQRHTITSPDELYDYLLTNVGGD